MVILPLMISASARSTLACDKIAMMPGSTIGDAEMRIGNERADEKYLSAWREEFAAMAEANGRDGEIVHLDNNVINAFFFSSRKIALHISR